MGNAGSKNGSSGVEVDMSLGGGATTASVTTTGEVISGRKNCVDGFKLNDLGIEELSMLENKSIAMKYAEMNGWTVVKSIGEVLTIHSDNEESIVIIAIFMEDDSEGASLASLKNRVGATFVNATESFIEAVSMYPGSRIVLAGEGVGASVAVYLGTQAKAYRNVEVEVHAFNPGSFATDSINARDSSLPRWIRTYAGA